MSKERNTQNTDNQETDQLDKLSENDEKRKARIFRRHPQYAKPSRRTCPVCQTRREVTATGYFCPVCSKNETES